MGKMFIVVKIYSISNVIKICWKYVNIYIVFYKVIMRSYLGGLIDYLIDEWVNNIIFCCVGYEYIDY